MVTSLSLDLLRSLLRACILNSICCDFSTNTRKLENFTRVLGVAKIASDEFLIKYL